MFKKFSTFTVFLAMLFAFSACNKNDSKASLNLSSSSSSFSTSASTTNLLWYESALPMDFVYKERHYMILTEFGTKTIVDKDEIGDLLGYLIREDDVEAFTKEFPNVDYVIDNGLYSWTYNNRVPFYKVIGYDDLSFICCDNYYYQDVTDFPN